MVQSAGLANLSPLSRLTEHVREGDAAEPAAGEGRCDDSDAVRKWRTVMLHPKSTRGLTLFAIEHQSPDDALPMAPPTSSPDSCMSALDHIVVSTRDIESTGAFYRDGLGLRLALDRSFEAVRRFGARSLGIAGGVSANSRLREVATARGAERGLPVMLPTLHLSTDNAAMIAAAGLRRLRAGVTASLDLNADAGLRL